VLTGRPATAELAEAAREASEAVAEIVGRIDDAGASGAYLAELRRLRDRYGLLAAVKRWRAELPAKDQRDKAEAAGWGPLCGVVNSCRPPDAPPVGGAPNADSAFGDEVAWKVRGWTVCYSPAGKLAMIWSSPRGDSWWLGRDGQTRFCAKDSPVGEPALSDAGGDDRSDGAADAAPARRPSSMRFEIDGPFGGMGAGFDGYPVDDFAEYCRRTGLDHGAGVGVGLLAVCELTAAERDALAERLAAGLAEAKRQAAAETAATVRGGRNDA